VPAESLLFDPSGSLIPENVFAFAVITPRTRAVAPTPNVGNVCPELKLPRLHNILVPRPHGPLVLRGLTPEGS
jgi:hypothetical protein